MVIIFGKKAKERIEELEKEVNSLSQTCSSLEENNKLLKSEIRELKDEVTEIKQTLQNVIDDGVAHKTGQQLVKEYLFGEEEDS